MTSSKRPSALVIHDDLATLSVLVDDLSACDVHVTTATSQEALARARGPSSFAVAVVGGGVLDGSADEVGARLMSADARVPLVLLAEGSPERLASLQDATHAVAVLSVPPDAATLRSVVGELTGRNDDPTILEKMVAHATMEAGPAAAPTTYRCSVCRWLLYVGRPDFVQGAFAGRRTAGTITCPACGHGSAFPPGSSPRAGL